MEMAMTGSLDIKQLRLPNQPLASSTPPSFVNLTAMTMTVKLRRRPQVQRICFRSWRIPSQFPSQENLNYLWKLGAGSIVGAAAIKYGSVLFPEITRPNLLEAIIIISSPVIVAVLLLIRQSRLQQ